MLFELLQHSDKLLFLIICRVVPPSTSPFKNVSPIEIRKDQHPTSTMNHLLPPSFAINTASNSTASGVGFGTATANNGSNSQRVKNSASSTTELQQLKCQLDEEREKVQHLSAQLTTNVSEWEICLLQNVLLFLP